MFEEMTGQPVSQLVTIITSAEGDSQVFIEDRDEWIPEFIKLRDQYEEDHGSGITLPPIATSELHIALRRNHFLGYMIHEVFYDLDGNVTFYCDTPANPFGDVPDELYEGMCNMMNAFDREPLNLDHVDYLLRRKDEENTGH